MRYYSSTSGEMVLQGAIAAGDTTITVDTTAGLPVAYPYTLFLDYGTASEEIVDVTAAAGTSLTVVRGRDGTAAQSHAFGAKIRHGLSARDLRESREHEAATGAHGVTTVVGATETQTLDNKTFQPSGDHAAVKLRTVSANTTPALDVRDQSDARRAAWYEGGLEFLFGANVVARIRQGGAVNLFKSILELRVSDDIHALVGTVTGTPTGRFLRLMSGASEIFSVASNGDLKARAGTFTNDVSVTGGLSVGGALSGATVTALQDADTALDGRLDTLEAQALDTRLDAVETNLGSQTTFAATSSTKDAKRIHWGRATPTPNGTGYATITHGAGFTPTVVNATCIWTNIAVDPDSITATTFEVRILNTAGASPAAPTKVSYFCGE